MCEYCNKEYSENLNLTKLGIEVWKDAWYNNEKCEGYQVSNMGNVKSLSYSRSKNEKLLKLADNGSGYLQACLMIDGKRKNVRINRLVASTFIPNPEQKEEVNHILEFEKHNNSLINIEWTTHKENCNHGTRNERMSISNSNVQSIPIFSIDKNNNVEFYKGAREAERKDGFLHGSIGYCCKGKLKTAHKRRWFYDNDENRLQNNICVAKN
jgi:hypothetical protein